MQRRRRRHIALAIAIACVVLLAVLSLGTNHSTIEAWAIQYYPNTRVPDPSVAEYYDATVDLGSVDWATNSITQSFGEPTSGIRSSGFLTITARVYDSEGFVPGARVVFTLSSETGRKSTIERTNSKGEASTVHWIPAEARGKPMIVTAEASHYDWNSVSSKWFVPE